MKRITKLTALALSVVVVIGCITVSSATAPLDNRFSIVELDSSRFSYEEHGVKIIRFLKIRSEETPAINPPANSKQSIYPIDPVETDDAVSPLANPERTATEVFTYGIFDRLTNTTVGFFDITVNGVWSQADGYGRVVSVGSTFYDCDYGEDRYYIEYSYESDSTVYVDIMFDNPDTGVTELLNRLKVVQHTNGNITCEIAPID